MSTPRLLILSLAVSLGPGCYWMHRPEGKEIREFPQRSVLVRGDARFEILYLPGDEASAGLVRQALDQAIPRVTRWGAFRDPVEVRIYPDHDSLEIAVRRYGYDWLRAWARYDEVFLQSPRSYSVFEGGVANLAELLTHEITHCLMYQMAATRSDWRRKDRQIPIWFREGMASWTAQQGHRRMSEARLARWLRTDGRDPLADAGSMYQKHAGPVYGASHWTFAFLVNQYGAGSVRGILAGMADGRHFADAFHAAVGLEPGEFESEVLRYFTWDGWIERQHPTPAALLGPPLTSTTAAEESERAPHHGAGAGAPPR